MATIDPTTMPIFHDERGRDPDRSECLASSEVRRVPSVMCCSRSDAQLPLRREVTNNASCELPSARTSARHFRHLCRNCTNDGRYPTDARSLEQQLLRGEIHSGALGATSAVMFLMYAIHLSQPEHPKAFLQMPMRRMDRLDRLNFRSVRRPRSQAYDLPTRARLIDPALA